jgi:hypothetical protein
VSDGRQRKLSAENSLPGGGEVEDAPEEVVGENGEAVAAGHRV